MRLCFKVHNFNGNLYNEDQRHSFINNFSISDICKYNRWIHKRKLQAVGDAALAIALPTLRK